ncbi:hypothetical protein CC78DRAFT_428018, partial [Lojkania enalia]
INSRGENWHSALNIAASQVPCRNVALLLDASAIIELEGGPFGTPLMGACQAGNLEAVKLLVHRGAAIS